MMDKERIDKVLLDLKLCDSRTKAQNLVKSGIVSVNNIVVNKPNKIISFDDKIEIISDPCPWVSRAGLKLSSVIKILKINIKQDSVCLDIGASTGGFSDVLLSYGVKQIFAVDVGHSQLHDKIRNDEKVVVLEKTDARNLNDGFIPPIDILVCDVSFVSILKIIEKPLDLLRSGGLLIVLIKPQFEVGKQNIGKGGIVNNEKSVIEVIKEIEMYFSSKCKINSVIPCEPKGTDGNQEYILYAIKN